MNMKQLPAPVDERTLVLLKGSHQYIFRYHRGEEIVLFYTLMEYAIDNQFNLTVKDLVHCTSKILKNLSPNTTIDLGKAA